MLVHYICEVGHAHSMSLSAFVSLFLSLSVSNLYQSVYLPHLCVCLSVCLSPPPLSPSLCVSVSLTMHTLERAEVQEKIVTVFMLMCCLQFCILAAKL